MIRLSVLLACLLYTSSAFSAMIVSTQTTGPVDADSASSWTRINLGTITLAQHTTHIQSLSTSAIAYDQGFGGLDPQSNYVALALYEDGALLWDTHVAGGLRGVQPPQTYNLGDDQATFLAVNDIMDAIDWSTKPTVTLELEARPLGFLQWELHVRDAEMSVTSQTPEPSTYAMLALGLLGLGYWRRNKKRA